MSQVDLSNKAIYDMVNDQIVTEKQNYDNTDTESVESSVFEKETTISTSAPQVTSTVPKQRFKLERSIKGFVVFVVVIVFIAAFIYFTIYRLGWGIKECINHNYQDCAALLTPELAPLAATGLLVLL
jgi:hypothetical protein